ATRRTRGTSCADAAAADSNAANTAAPETRRLFRRARYLGMEWIQVPVEEGPDAVPRVALLARVLGLPCLRVDAAVEGMAARRVVVDHRLGQRRLASAQRVHQLPVFFDVHVLVVFGHAHVERNLQLVYVVQRRAILV